MDCKKLYVGYNQVNLFQKEGYRKKIGEPIISYDESETKECEKNFSVTKISNKILFNPPFRCEILNFIKNKCDFEIKECDIDELKLEVECLKQFQKREEDFYIHVYKKDENPNALITKSFVTLLEKVLSKLEEEN